MNWGPNSVNSVADYYLFRRPKCQTVFSKGKKCFLKFVQDISSRMFLFVCK